MQSAGYQQRMQWLLPLKFSLRAHMSQSRCSKYATVLCSGLIQPACYRARRQQESYERNGFQKSSGDSRLQHPRSALCLGHNVMRATSRHVDSIPEEAQNYLIRNRASLSSMNPTLPRESLCILWSAEHSKYSHTTLNSYSTLFLTPCLLP